jgi:hypothetical protein
VHRDDPVVRGGGVRRHRAREVGHG